jgi:hypothetical protein
MLSTTDISKANLRVKKGRSLFSETSMGISM